jgi:membrane fusion protein (multidrug efflux system)
VISKQALEEKKAQWIDAQKRLSLAKIELDKSRFIAPFEGIVGVYKITPGSQVAEGESIVTLYDPTDVMVEFDIPGSLLHQLKDGQQVYVNGKSFPITHIQKMIDPETHMSGASVHFSCKNCFIGETVDVDLALTEHRNVIVIPTEALFLKNGQSFVYTVVDNKVTLKPVILGIREKEMVEIIDGIQTGEQLILRGQARLYPNAPVKIHSPTQLAKVTT